MNVCTLRCRVYFQAGMNSRAAWAALDHLMKQAMFNCETQLDRWSVLDFFCANFLSFYELPFGLGSCAFNVNGFFPNFIGFNRSAHVEIAAAFP